MRVRFVRGLWSSPWTKDQWSAIATQLAWLTDIYIHICFKEAETFVICGRIAGHTVLTCMYTCKLHMYMYALYVLALHAAHAHRTTTTSLVHRWHTGCVVNIIFTVRPGVDMTLSAKLASCAVWPSSRKDFPTPLLTSSGSPLRSTDEFHMRSAHHVPTTGNHN